MKSHKPEKPEAQDINQQLKKNIIDNFHETHFQIYIQFSVQLKMKNCYPFLITYFGVFKMR